MVKGLFTQEVVNMAFQSEREAEELMGGERDREVVKV